MTILDWSLIGLPWVLIVAASVFTRRYVKGVADFLAAGRAAGLSRRPEPIQRMEIKAPKTNALGSGRLKISSAFSRNRKIERTVRTKTLKP